MLEGQKTGFFFDQRENRLALKDYVQGRRTLDCFCYVGAWALSAARFGAAEVIGLDSSEKAIHAATENAALNGLAGAVSRKPMSLMSSASWKNSGNASAASSSTRPRS